MSLAETNNGEGTNLNPVEKVAKFLDNLRPNGYIRQYPPALTEVL
jgi:hypothetical protein